MEFEIGVDIVSIKRISRMLEKFGLLFLQKFLLTNEILLACKNLDFLQSCNIYQNCNLFSSNDIESIQDWSTQIPTHSFINNVLYSFSIKNKQYYESNMKPALHFLANNFSLTLFKIPTIAGFWALKEACSKSLGVGIGQYLSFHDICIFKDKYGKPHIAISDDRMSQWDIKKISVSMSHDCNIAFAVCVVV